MQTQSQSFQHIETNRQKKHTVQPHSTTAFTTSYSNNVMLKQPHTHVKHSTVHCLFDTNIEHMHDKTNILPLHIPGTSRIITSYTTTIFNNCKYIRHIKTHNSQLITNTLLYIIYYAHNPSPLCPLCNT